MAEHKNFEKQLYNAVFRGDLEETKQITDYLSKSKLWHPGNDLLCAALVNKNLDIVKFLLSHGSKVVGDRRNYGGFTALHLAVLYGDSMIVDSILKKGAFFNAINQEGMIPLHLVVYRNHNEFGYFLQPEINDEESSIILDILLQCGSNIDTPVRANDKNRYTVLHLAAECGNENIIPILLSRNAKPNISDRGGLTPLHIAAIQGHTGMVKKFLAHGAVAFLRDAKGKSPLRWAMEKKHMDVVKVFINYELPPSQQRYTNIPKLSDDKFVLISAVHLDNVSILQSLLNKGVFVQSAWGSGESALHVAVRRGNEDIVKLLLDYGANIKAIAKDGKTPLYLAVETGRVNIVDILLRRVSPYDSIVFLSGHSKCTPLHVAVMSDNEEMVRLLLQRGTQVYRQILAYRSHPIMSESLLHVAAKNGSLPICKLLLAYGADINSNDVKQRNALYFAAERGNLELVNDLCDISLNQEPKEKLWTQGYAALYVAAYDGNDQIVNLLLEKGVNVKANLANYSTPLHAATERNHKKVVEALLEKGFDVNETSDVRNGRTALHCAVEKGFYTIVKCLLQKGADVNAKITEKDKAGYTPLHCAAEARKLDIVMLLLQNGADVNAKTEANHTPLLIAVLKDENAIARCLVDHDANLNVFGNIDGIGIQHFSTFKHFLDINVLSGSIRPLALAILRHNIEMVEILLKSGSPVKIENETISPLHLAAENDYNGAIVRKLLQRGVDINSKCVLGHTSLFHAVHGGKIKTIRLFIKKGAHLHTKTKEGNSLLHTAVESYNANSNVIKILLECGLDVKTRNQRQEIPLHCRIFHYNALKDINFFKFLLEYGAEVNAKDEFGNTPLHSAVANSDQASVDVLLEYGANVNVMNVEGETALENCIFDFDDGEELFEMNVSIAKSIIKIIAIQKGTGLYISEKNLLLIKTNDLLEKCFEIFTEEFHKAMRLKVCRNVSFSDILSKNTEKLDIYFRNPVVIKILESTDLETLFPIYSPIFKARILRAKERKLLLETSSNHLKTILDFEFPTLIVQHIFSFLTSVDLKNMARVFQRPPSFMSKLHKQSS